MVEVIVCDFDLKREFDRQGKGSHVIWRSPGGKNTTITDHGSKSLSPGLINALNKIK